MTSPRRVAIGAALALATAAFLAGCQEDDPEPAPSPDPAAIEPEYPTPYMNIAVDIYNMHGTDGLRWRPVEEDGRRWTGDPRRYEKVCRASFRTDDGTIPDLAEATEGAQSWYHALQQDPERWAAFNAWLADPAVEAYVGPRARLQDGGLDLMFHADFSECEDAIDAGTRVK